MNVTNEENKIPGIVSGTAYWASIVSPNTTFDDDGVWEINVCNLEESEVSALRENGLPVKNKGDEKGDYVLVKRKVRRKDGSINKPPKIVDSNNTAMRDTLIGNGSLVNVKYRPYDWTFGNKQGVAADLVAIQIIDLVEYASASDEFDDVDGGYQAPDDDIPFDIPTEWHNN